MGDGPGVYEGLVERPRLVERLLGATVAAVEAGGGYGKTTLGRQVARACPARTIWLHLGPLDGPAERVQARLAQALRDAGLLHGAEVVSRAATLGAAVEELTDLLAAGAPVLVVVDDAHHLGDAAAAALAQLPATLAPPHRVLVLGRSIPEPLDRARAARDGPVLRTGDLELDLAEVAAVCAAAGVDLTGFDAGAVARVTSRWAAAVALTARRLAGAGEPLEVLAELERQPRILGWLLDQQLQALGPEASLALRQVALLPLVGPATDAVVACPGLFDQARLAGVPLVAGQGAWWSLNDAVREHLVAARTIDADLAQRAAALYVEHGEVPAALEVLLSAGADERAAALLATLPARWVARLDPSEIVFLVARLGDAAIRAHPRVLLHLARAYEVLVDYERRQGALARAERCYANDPAIADAVAAERVFDLARDGQFDEAEAGASALLGQDQPAAPAVRARLLHARGRARCSRATDPSLAAAAADLDEAAALWRRLDEPHRAAEALLALGASALFGQGRHDEALAAIDASLALLGATSRQRAVTLTFRAEVLNDCGRFDEAAESLAAAHRLGRLLGDHRVIAYASWEQARAASQAGDRDALRAALADVEAHRRGWFDHHTGVMFLADAADLADRLGDHDLAEGYLARARQRRAEAEENVRLAEGLVLARSGDPTQAEQVLTDVAAQPRLDPRERWRILLARAHAAQRRGDPAAATLAAEAFDQAGALGNPRLPLVKEPAMARALVVLAADAGSRCAEQVHPDEATLAVRVLGGFAVTRGGRPIELAYGHPQELVKVLAVTGRRHAEELIELLWPDTDAPTGRRRLRNLLNRVNQAAGAPLVVRSGDVLAVAEHVTVDARLFDAEARQVTRRVGGAGRHPPPGALGLARLALARYRGLLLPEDPYAAWAAEDRERLRRRALALVDILVTAAESAGDTVEALRLVELALEWEPLDERYYVRAAHLHRAAGRRAAARSVLQQARAMLDELGLHPSAALQGLLDDMAGPGHRPGGRQMDAGG